MEVGSPQIPARYPTHGTREETSPYGLAPTGLSPSLAPHSSGLRLHPSGLYGLHPAPQSGTTQLHIPLTFRQGVRFGLCRFRSPLLTASRLVSLPPLTEMFHFRGFPLPPSGAPLTGQEFPFGHPRIKGSLRLPGAFRSLARPSSAPEPSHPPGGIGPALLTAQIAWAVRDRLGR